jgi:soluble lytic murein transglycosylase-like protein
MTGRATTLLFTAGAAALVLSTIAARPAKLYVWNASASVPVGFYRLQPTGDLSVTQLVAVQPPEPLATFLADNSYLPRGIADAQARPGTAGTDRLQRRARYHCRQHREGRSARARQPGPPATCLARLPRHRRGRSLSHELAVGGLPRRAIFRGVANECDHRARGASLDKLGGMTLSPACKLSAIPLFGQNASHSSVPAEHHTAVARTGGQGRPSGRRGSASPLTAASTTAGLRSYGIVVWIVAILAASMLSSGSAHAERTSPPAHRMNGESVDPLAAYVTEASGRFGVPERWIRAVMRVESEGKQRARSKKGAMGLMQIMPGTWNELRSRYRLGADPYDVRDNILAGAAYIRELSDRYGTPGFLAAYNAGPGRYERHLATGRPLPDETQAYAATLAPMITRTRTNVQLVRSQDRLPGPTLHCSRRAPPGSRRIVSLRLLCARTAHRAPVAWSTYRRSYPTLASCSYTVPAR